MNNEERDSLRRAVTDDKERSTALAYFVHASGRQSLVAPDDVLVLLDENARLRDVAARYREAEQDAAEAEKFALHQALENVGWASEYAMVQSKVKQAAVNDARQVLDDLLDS